MPITQGRINISRSGLRRIISLSFDTDFNTGLIEIFRPNCWDIPRVKNTSEIIKILVLISWICVCTLRHYSGISLLVCTYNNLCVSTRQWLPFWQSTWRVKKVASSFCLILFVSMDQWTNADVCSCVQWTIWRIWRQTGQSAERDTTQPMCRSKWVNWQYEVARQHTDKQ